MNFVFQDLGTPGMVMIGTPLDLSPSPEAVRRRPALLVEARLRQALRGVGLFKVEAH